MCREGKSPSGPSRLIHISPGKVQVKSRWDETQTCILLGPAVSKKQVFFLPSDPPGRPVSLFLIKVGKTEQKKPRLYSSPCFLSPGIIFNKHFIFCTLSFIAVFTVPDLPVLFGSQIEPKAWYFSVFQPAPPSEAFSFCPPRPLPCLRGTSLTPTPSPQKLAPLIPARSRTADPHAGDAGRFSEQISQQLHFNSVPA